MNDSGLDFDWASLPKSLPWSHCPAGNWTSNLLCTESSFLLGLFCIRAINLVLKLDVPILCLWMEHPQNIMLPPPYFTQPILHCEDGVYKGDKHCWFSGKQIPFGLIGIENNLPRFKQDFILFYCQYFSIFSAQFCWASMWTLSCEQLFNLSSSFRLTFGFSYYSFLSKCVPYGLNS